MNNLGESRRDAGDAHHCHQRHAEDNSRAYGYLSPKHFGFKGVVSLRQTRRKRRRASRSQRDPPPCSDGIIHNRRDCSRVRKERSRSAGSTKLNSSTSRQPPTILGFTDHNPSQRRLNPRESTESPQVRLTKHRSPPGSRTLAASRTIAKAYSWARRSNT